jgi:hypothetical protein
MPAPPDLSVPLQAGLRPPKAAELFLASDSPMKPTKRRQTCLVFTGAVLLTGYTVVAAMGSAFTYQGRLADGGSVANGSYDLRFSLCDAPVGGAQVGATITNAAVAVSNGFFVVALDFGTNAFDGNARWLEIGVRKGTGGFTLLSPRQPVMPAPYAITAANLANPAAVVAGTFTGNFAGDGSALTNLNTSAVTTATNALWISSTNWVIAQGYQTTNGPTRKAISSPAPANGTNFVVNFANEAVQFTATNHITLVQSTNRPAVGWYGECVWYIQGGTTNWMLRVNTNWIGVGTLAANTPYLIASNKLTIVALSARGSSETNVTYAIARQE